MKITLTIPAFEVKALINYGIVTEKNVRPGLVEEGLEYHNVTIKYEDEECDGPHDTSFYKVRGYAGRELWLSVEPREMYDEVDSLNGVCERVSNFNLLT